jgi:hypothetical protein
MAGYSFIGATTNVSSNYTTIGNYYSSPSVIKNPNAETRIVIMEKLKRYKLLTSSSGSYSFIGGGRNNVNSVYSAI